MICMMRLAAQHKTELKSLDSVFKVSKLTAPSVATVRGSVARVVIIIF